MRRTSIPLLDLKAQYATIRTEVEEAIREVVEAQQFILGPLVEAFEQEFAAYLGVPHAIACASGSDALLLALMAHDVGPGNAVVCPPFAFFGTAGAIARLGAEPRFVDIEPEGYCLDPVALFRYLREGTTPDPSTGKLVDKISGNVVVAVMPVHLYGQPAEMDRICSFARDHDLAIIEDAAQAIGARYGGGRVGLQGDVGCFSFFPSKNLGAWGNGGLLVTRDESVAERLRLLRVHGAPTKHYHQRLGIDSYLDALQAAVLRVRLRHLDPWTKARQAAADRYDRYLAEARVLAEIAPPRRFPDRTHVFHRYVIRIRNRDVVRETLKACGVGTEIYYPLPLHLQPCFASLGWKAGDFPVAEQAAQEVLALPMYPELTEEQQRYVVESLEGALARA